jgi:hypothetical protein
MSAPGGERIQRLEAFSGHVKGGAHIHFTPDLPLAMTTSGWRIEVPTDDFHRHATILEGTSRVTAPTARRRLPLGENADRGSSDFG